MASSRVMPSSSTANSDLARQPSICSLSVSGDEAKNLGSMSMDDLLRNIYDDGMAAVALPETNFGGGAGEVAFRPPLSREGSFSLPRSIESKTAEVLWRDISRGRKADGGGGCSGHKDASAAAAEAAHGEMTLEDFLATAGVVMEEDVRVPPGSAAQGGFGVNAVMNDRFGQQQAQSLLANPMLAFGNGVADGGGEERRGGRGKKRPVLDLVERTVVLQRQKRMIKNRESAARSRERKQAYIVELESIVMQLEKENARLLGEQEELHRQRLKQLLEYVIPVTEKTKPPRALRRAYSMQW